MTHNKKPNVLSADTLKGNNVVNQQGEDIGEISELMIDLDYGQVAYAVLQFGGIMGLGDKLFAIPWEALKLDSEHHNFILNVDKNTIKEAEGFDQDDWPELSNHKWLSDTYDHYGYSPYWS